MFKDAVLQYSVNPDDAFTVKATLINQSQQQPVSGRGVSNDGIRKE